MLCIRFKCTFYFIFRSPYSPSLWCHMANAYEETHIHDTIQTATAQQQQQTKTPNKRKYKYIFVEITRLICVCRITALDILLK